MPDDRHLCTFYLGPLYLGVDVLRVQEVIREQPMTRVPLAPAAVRGLINLRGQIVTALDLRRRLDLPPRENGPPPVNVVVRTDDGAVCLLVDDIGDVIVAPDRLFEPPPETLRGPARELIQGTYKLADRLLLVLDTDRALAVRPADAPDSSSAPSRREGL